MTVAEMKELVSSLITALVGGGAIVLGLSNYFGQIFAKRYEEKLKAKFQNEINEYQSQLDIIKQTSIRYSDKQFEHYSKLWSSLYDLKLLADDLWQQATSPTLERFSRQLKNTNIEIEKACLFIEDSHYKELRETIRFFSEYQIGKTSLIDYRRNADFDPQAVSHLIASNGEKKLALEALIVNVKYLKRQIGGR